MPEIVARGRKEANIRACASATIRTAKAARRTRPSRVCRSSYFIQQMHDYRNGVRKSADPKKGEHQRDDRHREGDDGRGNQSVGGVFRIDEVDAVDQGRRERNRAEDAHRRRACSSSLPGGETEPIGQRIIEMPEDNAREALRDPRSGFVAYVPVGSIKKGEALVKTRRRQDDRVRVCHGADLKGLGPVPGLAGRSPSYSARQLFDMQAGARNGVWADLMKPVVAKLTEEDLINISAYTASLAP